MTRDEAIAKAMKLFKLAESTNVHEAALAAQRAQEILNKFNITNQMLNDELVGGEVDEKIENFINNPLDTFTNIIRWKTYLGGVLAKHNQCRTYTSGSSFVLVGRKSDAEVVKYLYYMLCRETDKLAAYNGKGMGKTWNNNFRYGVVDAIALKLAEAKKHTHDEIREEVIANPNALIKVNNAIAKLEAKDKMVDGWLASNLRLKTTHHKFNSSPDGRFAGQKAGKSIVISGAKGSLGSSKQRVE